MIRVLLVLDTCLMRTALAALLGREKDIDATPASWEEAPRQARQLAPDVCVFDAECPGVPEPATVTALLGSSAPCVEASGRRPAGGAHTDVRPRPARVNGSLGHGTAGGRNELGGHLAERPSALRGHLSGEAARDTAALVVLAPPGKPGLLRQAFEARAMGYVNKDAPPQRLLRAIRHVAEGERFVDSTLSFDFLQAAEMPLTPRELNVLSLAAEGASVSEIASSLHLSNGTVRNYMSAITRKTGARNRVDAIRISRGAGWV